MTVKSATAAAFALGALCPLLHSGRRYAVLGLLSAPGMATTEFLRDVAPWPWLELLALAALANGLMFGAVGFSVAMFVKTWRSI